ncbi:MAG: molybdopterin-dependent oxidoreductase [Acidobacteriota bacterium]|nr:molybdopterin-dependent oxidoreductase [Acidobacteriota bacterium]MDH3784538.1 molybdopterin-dependent oxidoreductase [Acidobacteriota bacterium]
MTACSATSERARTDRREFLKLLGIGAGAVGLAGCGEWSVPDRLVELALRGPGLETFRSSICGLCEGACGLSVRLVDGVPVGLKGNPRHPLNRGGLCPVGQAGLHVLYAPHRLTAPLRRGGGGGFEEALWDDVLAEIADRLGGSSRVAILTGEPGRLFDDLAFGFLRSLGSDRLVRPGAAASLPYALMQGLGESPAFDLGGADMVLSIGLDLYEDGPAPLHAISALIGSRPDGERAGLIHVGTRLSPSASRADERVLVRPGTHAALALGLAHVLVREGRYDRRFVRDRCFGFEDWTDDDGQSRIGFRRLLLERYYPDRAAQLCGCEPSRIIHLARRFAAASRPVAVWGGEAASGRNATWTGMATHALNALLGAIDRPGGVTLSSTIPLRPLVSEAPSPAFAAGAGGAFGDDPIAEIADGVLDGSRPLDALFVMSCDPLHESPAGERLRQALERIPLVVAVTPFRDETAAAAEIVLPGPVFLESWQAVTTPAGVPFSVLGLGAPVVEPPLFDTRHPADVLIELARRLGGNAAEALPWDGYESYLKHRIEGLAISGEGAVITSEFEDSWVQYMEKRGWRFPKRRGSEGVWAQLAEHATWWNPVRAEGDWDRLLATPSGRFEFHSQNLERRLRELGDGDLARGVERLGLAAADDEACLPHFEPPQPVGEDELVLSPFRPITARGRLGIASPMVLEMFGYPVFEGWRTWAELAPETAHDQNLEDGDEVEVRSERAALEAVVKVRPGTAPGVVHVPVGLGHREPVGAAAGIGGNPMELVGDVRDPLSGNLSPGATRVSLRLLRRRPHGGPPPEGGH